MKLNPDIIKGRLLYHLRRKRVIGGVYTHFDTLTKGFPSHLGKEVKSIAMNLIKEGLLISKPTSYGLQVSLNKERIREIEEFIFKVLEFKF
ncbi:MAG: hypothetical protein Q7S27_06940 [Nanoarchaeota archaeon]|nr:hypothetical protein [Nanoarchaeota archaeon]